MSIASVSNNNIDNLENNNNNNSVDEYYLRQQNRTHNHTNFLSPKQYDELVLLQNNKDQHDQQQQQQQHVKENSNSNSTEQDNTSEQQELPQEHKEQSKKQDNNNNNEEEVASSLSYTFVVVADTQLGMIHDDEQWETEMNNCTKVIQQINTLNPPPLFCCICGDLVNMTYSIYTNKTKPSWASTKSSTSTTSSSIWTKNECNTIRTKQVTDFKVLWNQLHKNIALICICGNHDVGNIPTNESIQQYTSEFGNDYLSFWINPSTINNINKNNTIVPSSTSSTLTSTTTNNPLSTFCIVFNSSLFNDPSQCHQYYNEQLIWIEQQLQYATKNNAKFIFMFCHHPLFVNNEDEDDTEDIPGSYYSTYRDIYTISDTYFHIPKVRRKILLNLCQQYNVNAIFCGHFHQNMILTTSFHMKLIITAPTSLLLYSNNPTIQNHYEPKSLGYRLITVRSSTSAKHSTNNQQSSQFQHEFISLE